MIGKSGLRASDRSAPEAGVSSLSGEFEANDDGSDDIYFSPEAPEGKESNWVHDRLEPWLDKTWRPGEIELVTQ